MTIFHNPISVPGTFFVPILVSFSDRDWSTSLFSWAYYGEIATLLAVNAMSPEPCLLICSKPLRKCCDGPQRTLHQSTPSWELQPSCSTNIASFGGACMTQATVCMNVTTGLLPDTGSIYGLIRPCARRPRDRGGGRVLKRSSAQNCSYNQKPQDYCGGYAACRYTTQHHEACIDVTSQTILEGLDAFLLVLVVMYQVLVVCVLLSGPCLFF